MQAAYPMFLVDLAQLIGNGWPPSAGSGVSAKSRFDL